ncbi:hypothetical protein BXZ70DRAFT_353219 [Cristinia sonorae]|uniref:C2H2-type domain-containing protein n=1 Tax=Cristinia sonorae TaxID=1940300 RepID=A0A8K0UJL7_9AGAR|nr:hypothetical protein BXZ70DRAFT_353219 [Cristinia sonorae]
MSNQDISATVPFKSELDLARSESRSATISLQQCSDEPGPRGDDHNFVHSVLSTDIHNTRAQAPTLPALKGSATPVAVPNLTKKARGRQVPTTKETLLRPGICGRSYACKVENCHKVFTRSEHLKRHIRSIHTNERRQHPSFYIFPLIVTLISIFLFSPLTLPVSRMHFSAYQCDEPDCGKFFTRHDNLLQHRRSHRGTTASAFTEANGASQGNPCDIPGPLGRVYTTNTLARESHQRLQASMGVRHSIEEVSATASMGVLLPSPLTTAPSPSLYSSMTDRESHSASGPRSPRSPTTRPSLHIHNTTHQQVYHHHPPHLNTNLPPHVRRHSHSGSFSSFSHQLHTSVNAMTTDSVVSAPGTSPTATSASATSATSPTVSAAESRSSYPLNYDYTSSNGSGSVSPPSSELSHTVHGHPPYLTALSCYYDIDVHASFGTPRAPVTHGQTCSESSGFHEFQQQHHYAASGSAAAPRYQQQPQQHSFVHISVPVQGDMINGRGSFLQWRV